MVIYLEKIVKGECKLVNKVKLLGYFQNKI